MVRIKQGKSAASTSQSKVAKKPGKRIREDVLKANVLALGGDAGDLEIIQNVRDDVGGNSNPPHDPALAEEVSTLLAQLKGQKPSPQGISKVSRKEEGRKEKKAKPPKDKKGDKKDGPVKERANDSKADRPQKTALQKSGIVGKPSEGDDNIAMRLASIDLKPTSYKPGQLVIPPTSHWYSVLEPLPASTAASQTTSSDEITKLTARAAKLHSTEIHTFETSSSTSEVSFLTKIISSGTLSDRLSALTLLVQGSPLHNIKALDTLRTMTERGKGKGGREESLKALRCIVDWWIGGGVPNRKLKYFRDQPLSHPKVTDQHLVVWFFEDWLKKYFFSVLQTLETLLLDPLPYVRSQAMTQICNLLRDKPEQEQNLLRLLVNKLGDTDKALCSRASYHLLQLLQAHPSMKSIIVREVVSLVMRPQFSTPSLAGTGKHIRFNAPEASTSKPTKTEKRAGNSHAKYYAIISFNQIVLTPQDKKVALQLVDVYFEIFKELLGEEMARDDQIEEVPNEEEGEEMATDKHGRVRENKRKGKGAKQKEMKGAAGFVEVEDAQSKLISAILTGINRALPFAKIDAETTGLNKHIDTLFRITHTSTFNISLQALVLVQQICSTLSTSSSDSSLQNSIIDRYYRALHASLHDPRLATSSKQAMYLNLLFKSIKADVGNLGNERIRALIRRFVQILVSGGNGATEFVAGGLFLLGELFGTIPGLRTLINEPPRQTGETYDPRKREPQYSHASSSPLWELTPLLNHYHPAISLHARQLLSSQPLTASADLSLNTLSHFLDRFVYKNPKKSKAGQNGGKIKGASAMQPGASGVDPSTGVKLIKGESGVEPVNQATFSKKKAEDVPVDQLFFHKYFTKKRENQKAKLQGKGEDELESSAAGSEGEDPQEDEGGEEDAPSSDEEEEEIWKAMKASMPKAEGDDGVFSGSELDDPEPDLNDELSHPSDDDDDDGEENGGESDVPSFVEGSDDEDLISLDGLVEYDGPDGGSNDEEGEEEWGGIEKSPDSHIKKRKRESEQAGRRKKLKSLPTFASYEDYAKMIEEGPEDDI